MENMTEYEKLLADRAEFERRVKNAVLSAQREQRQKDAKAVVDMIERTPVVREVAIGVVSVLSVFSL